MAMLTYSGLHKGVLTKEGIVRFVADRAKESSMAKELIEWSCGREPHEDPNKEHFHVYVKFKGRPSWKWGKELADGTKTQCILNIPYGNGQVAVCRVDQHDDSKARDVQNEKKRPNPKNSRMTMIRYTMKGEQSHEEFVAQHEHGPNYGKNTDVYQSDGLLTEERAKMSRTEMGEAMRDASSVEEAVNIGWENDPIWMMQFGDRAESMLRKRKGGYMEKDYELKDFERPALDLSKPVLLPGKAGMGKTHYAMAHGKYPLRIKTLDDLKKIVPGTTDLLVFDDDSSLHVCYFFCHLKHALL
jgi:hypothetical protein